MVQHPKFYPLILIIGLMMAIIGCNNIQIQSHEDVYREHTAILESLADILEAVDPPANVSQTVDQIEDLVKQVQEINQQGKGLPKLTVAEYQKMRTKYEDRRLQVQERVRQAIQRITGELPEKSHLLAQEVNQLVQAINEHRFVKTQQRE